MSCPMTNGIAKPKSVCVIGAGVAGLCALRHFTARPHQFEPVVCYEQTDLIGGTWNYTDRVGLDHNGLPVLTSMYPDLRTNAPAQVMEYPDFGWHYSKSFPDSAEVLEYIHDYVDHFSLLAHIEFEHHLKRVTRDHLTNTWALTLWDIRANRLFTRNFDILILCPGRSCIPLWPQIESISAFTGDLIHVHDYRSKQPYTGKRVAIIGAGPSGFDMTVQISSVAAQIIFINRTAVQFENLPSNVRQIKGTVKEFGSNCIRIQVDESEDDEMHEIDSVIIATGYRIHLDYLDWSECGLELNRATDTLNGIYRHLVNIKYPSMALLSIIRPSINFPLYHQQILYYIKLILGEIAMPSQEQMHEEVQAEWKAAKTLGLRDSERHLLKVPLMRKYFQTLERDASLEPTWPSVFDLLEEVAKVRRVNPLGYKQVEYRLVDANTFQVI